MVPNERRAGETENKETDPEIRFGGAHGYFKLEGRFPAKHRDIPTAVVRHLARQLAVHPTLFTEYALDGRTAEADRAAIRHNLGWRPATDDDGEQLVQWLHEGILSDETDFERLVDLAVGWFRERRIEPLSEKSMDRCIRTATRTHETKIFAKVAGQISERSRRSLDQLLESGESDDAGAMEVPPGVVLNLNDLRSDPARPGLESVFGPVRL